MRSPIAAFLLLGALAACGGGAESPAPEPASVDPAVAPPRESSWSVCVRASELDGVARETIPGLDLELDGVRVVTGSLGQRGPDVEVPDKALRIAAVGGELTFGAGLPAEQAWPIAMAAQLDRTILSSGRAVVALDLGTVSASVLDVLRIARARAPGWSPRLLVLELDAARMDGASRDEVAEALRLLRVDASAIACGVLVAVGTPLASEAPVPAWERAADELLATASAGGLATLDLRAVLARTPREELVSGAEAHASAKAQAAVFEAVKQSLFHTGLLGEALGGH